MKRGNVYKAPYEEYFSGFDPLYIEYRQKANKAINQLVERYNIKGKFYYRLGLHWEMKNIGFIRTAVH